MRDRKREEYYSRRAPVYDATSYRGDPEVDAALDRESAEIEEILRSLVPARTLDVGCGTATWTRFLPGPIVALDQSAGMLRIARARVPHARFVRHLFPPLPFADREFDRIFTANFYGLLRTDERAVFLAEAQRVADELIVLDLRSDGDTHVEGIEPRTVGGRTFRIYRRRFTPESLLAELSGDLIYRGRFFLAVRQHFSLLGGQTRGY